MYTLLTLEALLLLLFTIKYFKFGNNKNLLLLLLITIAGGLTHYYFYIYAFFLTLTACLILLFGKNIKDMFKFGLLMLFGVIANFFIFPYTLDYVLNTNRGNEATNATFSAENTWNYIQNSLNELFGNHIWAIIIIIILLGGFIYSKYKLKDKVINYVDIFKVLSLMFIPTIFTLIANQTLASLQSTRYIYYLYHIIIILIVYLFDNIYKYFVSFQNINIGILIVVLTSSLIVSYNTQDINYLYEGTESKVSNVNDYSNNNALVLTDEKWRLTELTIELKEYDNIYQHVTSENDFKLPNNNIFSNKNSLVLYIFNELDTKENLKNISNHYNMDSINHLYSKQNTSAYYLER